VVNRISAQVGETMAADMTDVVRWLAQLDRVFGNYSDLFERIALGTWKPTPDEARTIAASIAGVRLTTRQLTLALTPTTCQIQ
jgi:hypothetical protein